jgi:hypothetical protein
MAEKLHAAVAGVAAGKVGGIEDRAGAVIIDKVFPSNKVIGVEPGRTREQGDRGLGDTYLGVQAYISIRKNLGLYARCAALRCAYTKVHANVIIVRVKHPGREGAAIKAAAGAH